MNAEKAQSLKGMPGRPMERKSRATAEEIERLLSRVAQDLEPWKEFGHHAGDGGEVVLYRGDNREHALPGLDLLKIALTVLGKCMGLPIYHG